MTKWQREEVMCVSVCFARNNDEMFERDSIWSDTDKIFKERESKRTSKALSLLSPFSPITHPPLGGNIGHTRQHPSCRVHTSNSFPPFLRNWTEATPGSRSVRTNFSVFKHARRGPKRIEGPVSQHFRWEKMRVFPSQYPTARSFLSARKEREATPWVVSSGE